MLTSFVFSAIFPRLRFFFLLPWQRDETTSPLDILESKFKKVSHESQSAKGRGFHVPFFLAPFLSRFSFVAVHLQCEGKVFHVSEEGPRILFS